MGSRLVFTLTERNLVVLKFRGIQHLSAAFAAAGNIEPNVSFNIRDQNFCTSKVILLILSGELKSVLILIASIPGMDFVVCTWSEEI